MASAERTVKDAGTTATREVTDSWLTLQTKLALLADERVSSGDVHVTTQRGVITLRGKVDSEAEQQAAGEIARTIEGAREVSNQLTVVPQAERKAVERQDDQIVKDVKTGDQEGCRPEEGPHPCACRRGDRHAHGEGAIARDERPRLRDGPPGVRRARRAERADVVAPGRINLGHRLRRSRGRRAPPDPRVVPPS